MTDPPRTAYSGLASYLRRDLEDTDETIHRARSTARLVERDIEGLLASDSQPLADAKALARELLALVHEATALLDSVARGFAILADEALYRHEEATTAGRARADAERMVEARRELVRAGYWPGGTPPTGYAVTGPKGRRVLVASAAAERVRAAFERVAEGSRSHAAIARDLDFDPPALSRMLRHPAYNPHADYPGRTELIVPPDVFEAAQEALAALRDEREKQGRRRFADPARASA